MLKFVRYSFISWKYDIRHVHSQKPQSAKHDDDWAFLGRTCGKRQALLSVSVFFREDTIYCISMIEEPFQGYRNECDVEAMWTSSANRTHMLCNKFVVEVHRKIQWPCCSFRSNNRINRIGLEKGYFLKVIATLKVMLNIASLKCTYNMLYLYNIVTMKFK